MIALPLHTKKKKNNIEVEWEQIYDGFKFMALQFTCSFSPNLLFNST